MIGENTKRLSRVSVGTSVATSLPGTVRAILFVLLGYAYVVAVLTAVAALATAAEFALFPYSRHLGYAAVKSLVPVLVVASLAWRTLELRPLLPRGRVLRADDAPGLFMIVDELRRALGGPRIDELVITDDVSVSLAKTPRFGLVGWYTTSLTIGLPLLLTTSPAHLRALIAQNLALHRGRHARFDAWIQERRITWIHMLRQSGEERQRGAFLVDHFTRWYAPRLFVMTAEHARRHALWADASAASVAGPESLAGALIHQGLVVRFFADDYWPAMYAQADRWGDSRVRPFASLSVLVFGELIIGDAPGWFAQTLQEPAPDDAAPAVAERLAALRVIPEARRSLAPGSAELFQTTVFEEMVTQFDETWSASFKASS